MENIINTGYYMLIVDDSEIKKETYCYDSINNILVFYKGSMKNIGFQKVISHLPLNNSPILENVPLLPPLEDDNIHFGDLRNVDVDSFMSGYNKAEEKYNLTLDKLLDLYIEESGYGMDMWSKEENATMNIVTKIIQSLQQPKMPVGFKCEIEAMNIDEIREQGKGFLNTNTKKLKTITNSQGLTQLVGEYIY
jgi:hypothetical protein